MGGWGHPVTAALSTPSSSCFSPAPERVLSWAAVLHDKPTPSWALHRPEIFQDISICFGMGSSTGCSADICSTVVLSMDCREISVLPSFPQWASDEYLPWCLEALPPHPPPLFLVFARLFLTLFSSLPMQQFYPFLCYHRGDNSPSWLMGSAGSWLGGSMVEPPGTGCGLARQTLNASHEATPAAPTNTLLPAPKIHY